MSNVLDNVSSNLRAILDDPPDRPWQLDDDDIDQLTTAEREEYAEQVEEYTIGVLIRHAYLLGNLDVHQAREAQLEQYRQLFAKQEEIIEQLHAALAEAHESDDLGGQLRRMLASRNEELQDELDAVRFVQSVEAERFEQDQRVHQQRKERARIRRELYERYLNEHHGQGPDLARHVVRCFAEEEGRLPTVEELVDRLWHIFAGGDGSEEGASEAVLTENVRGLIEDGELAQHVSVPYGSDDAWVDTVMKEDDDIDTQW